MTQPLRALPLLPVLALAACVAAPGPRRAPPLVSTVPVAPAPAATDWQDRALTAGGWRYALVPHGSQATFGTGVAALTCRSGRREVALWVGGGPRAVTVRTTSATRQLTAAADGTIALAATDPLLDAMAFSRGRFTVEAAGAAPLVLPAQAEIGRVVEDCRR